MEFRDYDIRTWSDGDVTINCPSVLGYGQISGLSGLQCNCDESDPMRSVLRDKCMDVANAMRALDETVAEIERMRDGQSG